MKEIKKRDEIDAKYKWKLEDLFENAEAWQKAADAAEIKISEISKFS